MAFQNRKEKLTRIPHIIAGFIILLHGYERYEDGHQSYLFFFIAGLIFLLVAFFHHQLVHQFPFIDTIFFAIEGLLSLIIAYEYLEAGKKGLPIAYLVAGMLQIGCIYFFIRRKKQSRI